MIIIIDADSWRVIRAFFSYSPFSLNSFRVPVRRFYGVYARVSSETIFRTDTIALYFRMRIYDFLPMANFLFVHYFVRYIFRIF